MSATPTSRGDLSVPGALRPVVHRSPPLAEHARAVRHHWVVAWDLPEGAVVEAPVLTYAACNAVVEAERAGLHPPAQGVTVQRLSGRGFAAAALLRPWAGYHLAGRQPLDALAGRAVPLAALPGGEAAEAAVRAAAGTPERWAEALALLGAWVCERLPDPGDEDQLVDAVVAAAEEEPDLHRAGDLGALVGLGERALERLTRRRLGVTPKWLLQRRRLQDAAHELRASAEPVDLSALAQRLGYADYSHFSRDFSAVVGLTPAAYRRSAHPPRDAER